jgi:hypothetical protein
MLIRFLFIVLVPLCTISFSETEKPTFNVEFVQNNKIVPIEEGTVTLEKDMFRLKVSMHDIEGVYMSASRKKAYYDLKDDEEIPDFRYIASKVGAEYPFNKNQEIVVHEEYLSFLCASKVNTECNKLDAGAKFEGKNVTGYKTVKYVSFSLKNKKKSVKKFGKDLYLFFFATNGYKIDEKPIELGRMKVILKWKKV